MMRTLMTTQNRQPILPWVSKIDVCVCHVIRCRHQAERSLRCTHLIIGPGCPDEGDSEQSQVHQPQFGEPPIVLKPFSAQGQDNIKASWKCDLQ